ncbi:2-keto-myo-inositol dehydratase [Azotobacter vinelandii CA]|uniref:2-keto-myo-inositol dehydratase n=2 Tax=Azotobacter vinelandii TaxID=354 RepID=C1DLA2_AZOVD|nr:myo-inosose-2 dehydratase [Azotobacter vinelandii]ACO81095.1 2-keto-myo-inositol dehydratase [Azotobacter vinelandii DJ]AGK13631.1 2-keto-myo-inositol dehydratase [Azotobacter vinelandii CA]AGK18143.1 2-keto-myo-inositol dehydratase [Azotobacter vinelandii CA6]WKN21842.1 myo-inosose-2 dehydratase [Azotobacter vinelandii]SFX93430.1 inosose dehydratase [Azotobacter vinelandii]
MTNSPVKIGINPISWSNDDLPSLGGETPLSTALSEGKAIGYQGFELNGKFPKSPEGVRAVLAEHGLELVSGWYSSFLAQRSVEEEIEAIAPHCRLLAENGAKVLVYGEVAGSIQGRRIALGERPRFYSDDAWKTYGEKVTELARYTLSQGLRLAYHHHMGAYVQAPEDIDRMMEVSGEEVGLLFDAGHCYLGGGDPLAVLRKHLARVCHVHCKDVREGVVRLSRNEQWSFPECIVNGTFTVPGDGDIDFEPLLDTLLASGYRGWLVVEAEQDPAVAPSHAYAKKGFETLRDLVARLAPRYTTA